MTRSFESKHHGRSCPNIGTGEPHTKLELHNTIRVHIAQCSYCYSKFSYSLQKQQLTLPSLQFYCVGGEWQADATESIMLSGELIRVERSIIAFAGSQGDHWAKDRLFLTKTQHEH